MGSGADVVIEAVGVPATFELCTELVRPGGHVANIGVHGKPATLHLESLWTRDVTITTGLVDTFSTPTLLRLVTSRQIEAETVSPPITSSSTRHDGRLRTTSMSGRPTPGRSRSFSHGDGVIRRAGMAPGPLSSRRPPIGRRGLLRHGAG